MLNSIENRIEIRYSFVFITLKTGLLPPLTVFVKNPKIAIFMESARFP